MRKLCMMIAMILVLSLSGCVIEYNSDVPTESTGVVELQYQNDAESAQWYYYNQLTAKQKVIYCEILRQTKEYRTYIEFREYDLIYDFLEQNEMWQVEMAFSQDHPEFFWTTSYLAINREYDVSMIDYRNATPADAQKFTEQLHSTADTILQKLPQGTDYEKVKWLYNYILDNTDFNTYAQYNQDIRGVLLKGEGVCNSYTYTFKFLCDKANIPCIIVPGYSNNGKTRDLHAWNAVQLDDVWYWVDTTWGDTTDTPEKYLCTTDSALLTTHTLHYEACDPKLTSSLLFTLPSCTTPLQ